MRTICRKLSVIAVFFICFQLHAQDQVQKIFFSSTNGKTIDENNRLKVVFHVSDLPDSLSAVQKAHLFKQYEGVKKVDFKGFEAGKAKYVFTLTSFADDRFIERMLTYFKYNTIVIDNETVPVAEFSKQVARPKNSERKSELEK